MKISLTHSLICLATFAIVLSVYVLQQQVNKHTLKLEELETRLGRQEAFNQSRFDVQREDECFWMRKVLFASDDELVLSIRIESTDPCKVKTVCGEYQSEYAIKRNLLEMMYIDDFSFMLVRERDSTLRVSFASSSGFEETQFISFPSDRPLPDANDIIAGGGVMVTSGDRELLNVDGHPVSVKLSFPVDSDKNLLAVPMGKSK